MWQIRNYPWELEVALGPVDLYQIESNFRGLQQDTYEISQNIRSDLGANFQITTNKNCLLLNNKSSILCIVSRFFRLKNMTMKFSFARYPAINTEYSNLFIDGIH